MRKLARAIPLSALLVVLTVPASSQEARTPAPAPPAKADDYVTEKGMKGRVFDVKHRDPGALATVFGPLGSGFRGAVIKVSLDLNTITVRDFPENIAAMEDALKRLDVAAPPRPDVELTIHVLISSSADAPGRPYPVELADVVKRLESTLNYKSYHLVTSIIRRMKEGGGGSGDGSIEVVGPPLVPESLTRAGVPGRIVTDYTYDVSLQAIRQPDSGPHLIVTTRERSRLSWGRSHQTGLRKSRGAVVGTASLCITRSRPPPK
jgi:hypothetical protein